MSRQANPSRLTSHERGTKSWIVLAGAVIVLGIATTAVVSARASTGGNETAAPLASTTITARFAQFAGDFSSSAGGFMGGALTN